MIGREDFVNEAGRQADRQTGRQAGRQADRQADRHTSQDTGLIEARGEEFLCYTVDFYQG
jgi:hypothetical protein